jgi:hypothetical protein
MICFFPSSRLYSYHGILARASMLARWRMSLTARTHGLHDQQTLGILPTYTAKCQRDFTEVLSPLPWAEPRVVLMKACDRCSRRPVSSTDHATILRAELFGCNLTLGSFTFLIYCTRWPLILSKNYTLSNTSRDTRAHNAPNYCTRPFLSQTLQNATRLETLANHPLRRDRARTPVNTLPSHPFSMTRTNC